MLTTINENKADVGLSFDKVQFEQGHGVFFVGGQCGHLAIGICHYESTPMQYTELFIAIKMKIFNRKKV